MCHRVINNCKKCNGYGGLYERGAFMGMQIDPEDFWHKCEVCKGKKEKVTDE